MEAVVQMPAQARHVDIDTSYDTDKYDVNGYLRTANAPPITIEDINAFDSMGFMDVSKIIVDLLIASDNQNATVLVTGPPGSGKSELAMALSWNIALRLAAIRYGDPAEWRRIYPYRHNTAIIDPAEIMGVMEGTGDLQVRFLDDVFRALDRLGYYTDEQQYFSYLMSFNRVDNACTIMTTQYTKQLNAVIRNLARFWIRVKRNKYAKDRGANEFTMYKLEKNEMDNKSMPMHPHIRDIKNRRRRVHDTGITLLAPAELRDYYIPRRKKAVENMKIMKKRENEREKEEKINRRQQCINYIIDRMNDGWDAQKRKTVKAEAVARFGYKDSNVYKMMCELGYYP